MNNEFDELAKGLAQSVTRRQALKRFGAGLAGMALACFGLAMTVQAQTSVVCDPAGDAIYGSGKGGPAVPAWLDIIQSEITTDSNGDLLFTLTMNAAIPVAPAWNGVDDGGQLWWGWRIVGDFATDTVASGCAKANGNTEPAGYFVDLIWEVQSSSFHARLLDDTSCTQSLVNAFFSNDRTQFTLVVPRALLINKTLIPNPDIFQYVAVTVVRKANSIGNSSFYHLDYAPNLLNGQLTVGTWSASGDTSYSCP